MEMVGNVATITNFTVFTAPIMVIETGILIGLGLLYYLAIHTHYMKNEWLAARLFMGFHSVWRWLVTGLICCAFLFALALVMRGPNAIALRDTSLTLFLFIGWGGILSAAWKAFAHKPKKPKKSRKGKRP